MRVARAFSTSFQRTKQALYEPYAPPLNQEQKKALRKVLMAREPKFNSKFSKDAQWILKAYDVSRDTLQKRKATLQRVREIVQAAFGSQFSVMDRSLYKYAKDFDFAPLEFSIMDNRDPIGFPPEKIGKRFSDAYDHQAIARLLQNHGYSGSFVFGDAMRNQPPQDQNTPNILPFTERGVYPRTYPWPTYTPYPTLYLTYPPVLWAVPDDGNSETMSFFLSPPVPTHEPLIRLLKTYTSMGDFFSDLVTFIFLWTRSIDIPELTPTCVALMVIGWLQHQGLLPSIQNPKGKGDLKKLAERDEGVWFASPRPSQGHAEPMWSSTWLETGFLTTEVVKPLKPKKLASLMHDFFKFWSLRGEDSRFTSTTQYLSVREGTLMHRRAALEGKSRPVLERDDKDIARGFVPALTDQPRMWQTQPIVIPDPFVPSFNHAQSMSRIASNYFSFHCSNAQRIIARTHPAITILGTHLPKPPRAIRRYSTSLSQEIERMYEASLPPQPILEARQKLISRVQKVISKRFGNGYTLECFGSTRYGVSTATSDLDLVIIDQEHVCGFRSYVNPNNLPDVYNVWTVARTLVTRGFVDVIPISHAAVPIVKFRDPISNLECDLNINEQLGLWNTRLVTQYCALAPTLLRPLIVVIKGWAKSHGINDPSGSSGPASFSSYALVLMIIGYLQIRGVLPVLQADLGEIREEAKQGIFWLRAKTGGGTPCDVRFRNGHGWTPQAELSLEDAFSGWFTFWAEYQYDTDILSIREGKLLQRLAPRLEGKKKKKKKKQKKDKVTQLPEGVAPPQSQQLSEPVEGTAGTAFSEQHKQENSEDVDDVEDAIIETVENCAPENTKDPSAELQTHEEMEEADLAVEAEDDASDLLAGQPSKWRNCRLVVADPFILSKNVCGNISNEIVARFHAECRASVQMLEWGAGLEDLMGEKVSSPPPRQMRGRGRAVQRGRGRGQDAGRVDAVRRGRERDANHQQGSEQDIKAGDKDGGRPPSSGTLPSTSGQ